MSTISGQGARRKAVESAFNVMAIMLYPDGRSVAKIPENGRWFTRDEKRNYVPGYDEMIFISDKGVLLTISEGLERGEAYNEQATQVLRQFTKSRRDLFGPVLWLDVTELENDTRTGCPEIHAAYDLERLAVEKIRYGRLECLQI